MSFPTHTVDIAGLHAQLAGLSIASTSQTRTEEHVASPSPIGPMPPSVFRQLHKLWAGHRGINPRHDIPRVIDGHKFNPAKLHEAVLFYCAHERCSIAGITLDGWIAIGTSINWRDPSVDPVSQPPCGPQVATRLSQVYHQYLEPFDSLYLLGAFRDDLTEVPIHAVVGALGSNVNTSRHSVNGCYPDSRYFGGSSLLVWFQEKYGDWAVTRGIKHIWRLMIFNGALLDLYALCIEAHKIGYNTLFNSGPHDEWYHWNVLGDRLGYVNSKHEETDEVGRSAPSIGLRLMTAYCEYIAGFTWRIYAAWAMSQDLGPLLPSTLDTPSAEEEALLESLKDMSLDTA